MERILIIGGKVQAKSLAVSLVNKKYPVTVINNDLGQCEALSEVKGLHVFYGDASSPFILKEAEADKCDIAIVLGDHDADNLVISMLCKKVFHIKKTIALVNDSKKTAFFYTMGVDSAICATSAINSILEQSAIANELATNIPIGETRVRISEVLVTEASPIVNKKLINITLPSQAIIGCIIRGEQTLIPRGNTEILKNDMLLLISNEADEQEAIKVITGK